MSREQTLRPDQFKVALRLSTRWGDLDALGHVNNTRFLTFFESARVEYFGRMGLVGWEQRTIPVPLLASTRCDFLLPLGYPNELISGVRVTRIGNTSIEMEHALFRERTGELAARGSALLVMYDFQRESKIPVPDGLRERIRAIEGPVPGAGLG